MARIGWQLEALRKAAISFMLWDVNKLTYKPDRHSYLNPAFLEANKQSVPQSSNKAGKMQFLNDLRQSLETKTNFNNMYWIYQ